MTKLITAIYRRMLLATILVIVAAALCGVIYFRGESITSASVGYCGNSNSDFAFSSKNQGQQIFIQNCASCHHPLKNLTGPALAGFQQRFPMEHFYSFMSDPAPLLKRNKYLKELKEQYGGMDHPEYKNLNKEQLDELLSFLTNSKIRSAR